jgi:hypothetical protein
MSHMASGKKSWFIKESNDEGLGLAIKVEDERVAALPATVARSGASHQIPWTLL